MKKVEALNMDSVDKRIMDLKLKKGEMTDKFLAKYLATLPDLAGQFEEIPADLDKRRPSKS
jgi:hypothetical protein